MVLRRRSYILVLSAIIMLSFLFAGCSGEEEHVAVVNGEEISREEFDRHFESAKEMFASQGMSEIDEEMEVQVQEMLIDQMIEQMLLRQAAEEADYSVEDEEINEYIESLEENFETDEEFEEYLSNFGLSKSELWDEIHRGLLIEQYMLDTLELASEVTDEDVEEFYEENKEFFGDAEFEELEEMIRQQIKNEKMEQEERKLVEQLREEAEIEINI